MSKDTLVTGGLGFIGGHLVDRLLADGYDVTVIDSNANAPDLWNGDVEIIRARVQDVPVIGFDAVYHLAGLVGPALLKDGGYAEDILAAGWRMKDAMDYGSLVVYISTSEVYGDQPNPLSEDLGRVFPAGAWGRLEYPAAKMMLEISLANHPGQLRIVRPFNVAGPRQSAVGGFVVPRFIETALRGDPLTIYQPGTQRRAFTHVSDFVDGFITVAERGKDRHPYNIGNPSNECSIEELAHEILAEMDSDVGVKIIDPRTIWGPNFSEAPDKVPVMARAYSELGWSPKIDRATIIADCVGWYLDGS